MSKRPYKPTKLKVIEGNRSKVALPENEPTPRPIMPKVPKDLSDEGEKVWERIAPKLEKLGLLTEIDGDMFGGMCEIRSRLAWIYKELQGCDEKQRPFLMKEERLYSALFRMFAREFGMSPVGRVGLSVGGKELDEDDL